MVTPDDQSLVAGAVCLDFSNTVSNFEADTRTDRINAYVDLLVWSEHAGILRPKLASALKEKAESHRDEARAVYERSNEVREAIFSVFSALARSSPPPDSDLKILNAALQDSAPHRILRSSSAEANERAGVSWSWAPEDDLARPLWTIVQSAVELLTTADLNRIKMCEGRNCTWLFLDESRNRSRKWCEMETCGNRAKARRYRESNNS